MSHILQIAYYRSNYPGNFIASLSSLYSKARDSGDQMTFVFPISPRPDYNKWMGEFKQGKDIVFLDFESKGLAHRISEIIKTKGIDIVHASFFPTSAMIKIRKECGKHRYFFHIHSNPLHGRFVALKTIRNRLLLPKDIEIIACSPYIGKACRHLFPHNPVAMVQNGIEPARLARKEATNKQPPIRFLMFGYNVEVKGVDLAVESFLQISPREATLDIVVTAHMEEVRDALDARFGALPPTIRLVDPQSDVNILYENHDAFLSASRTEGLSYALIEAYYVGLPVISSDIPQSKDIGLPGIAYFRSGDADSLLSAIKELLNNTGKIKNDPKYVIDNCSVDHWSDAILSLYKKQ